MSKQPPRPPTRRTPLGEATRRINNEQIDTGLLSKKDIIPHHESRPHSTPSPVPHGDYHPHRDSLRAGSPNSNVANPRLSAISRTYATDSNRNSQISTTSTDSKKIKSHIGPWKLGRTLGKGSTARVRLARHAYTGQEAAIKIVQKKCAQISQAGSLAHLDKADPREELDPEDGTRRMPIGIEREVAIMKLVQHPNIMRLYDIWENRTEIYLVLEFVDGGELFGVITANGKLTEVAAVTYLRQILAGVGYCHSLNICHRDLKPENILLTGDGQIKIADFGMAALHQSPEHQLKTSCGSPHYAAPEVVSGVTYRGDKADIWSVGVILYATLAGKLPFDADSSEKGWIDDLLRKIKRGSYHMPSGLSPEMSDLIWRLLQVRPKDRITMSQIWRHPAVRKHDYLDNYDSGRNLLSPSLRHCVQPVFRRSDISKELLSHMRALWHSLSEKQVMDALLSDEPNDQKLFYSLLVKYRDAQLENYTPDLPFSASDYHHVKDTALARTYSTCHFPQPKSKGHGRQASRFTVISNAADTEHSYDPFKASRPQHLDFLRPADHPKVTIHRRGPISEEMRDSLGEIKPLRKSSQTAASVATGSERGRQQKLVIPRTIASRSSLASSTRSKNSLHHVRATVGHKRGVDFSHIRRRSAGSQKDHNRDAQPAAVDRHSNHTEVTDNGGDSLHPVNGTSTDYIRSKKKAQTAVSGPPVAASNPRRGSQLWTEDVRQLSSSLAMDCDEAFNRTSVVSDIDLLSNDPLRPNSTVKSSTRHISQPPTKTQNSRLGSLDNRPLPPPPARTESLKVELLEARKLAELRKTSSGGDDSSGYLDRVVSHIDRLMQTSSPERRTSSAPPEGNYTVARPLPSVFEARREAEDPRRPTDLDRFLESRHAAKANRNASAPEPQESKKRYHDDRFLRPESGIRETIRVVEPSSPSPVKVPAPLTIRKKSSMASKSVPIGGVFSPGGSRYSNQAPPPAFDLRQQAGSRDLGRINEDNNDDDQFGNVSTDTVVNKKSTWFKRNSKGEDGGVRMSIHGADTLPSKTSSIDTVLGQYLNIPLPQSPVRKGFNLGRLFKKRPSKTDMAIGALDMYDDAASLPDSTTDFRNRSLDRRTSNYSDPETRQIEPQQNWLAKLFNIKPAAKTICFSVSNRRARQEIVTILKEWKRYGIKDIEVDKRRNIVFGKVGSKNFLDLQEVAFAAEVMKVIEHGKRSHLSIARFTQEVGAASSFHKVVETLETVLKCRGMLVTDDRKRRMMVKTLNAAS